MSKIISYSFEDIVELHNDIIDRFGGDEGIMNPSSLDFAVDRIKYYSDDTTLFDDIALLVRAITQDHPFVDGNKRTGLVLAQAILRDNGLQFDLDYNARKEFILSVAKCEFNSLEELSKYIENNVKEY